VGRGVERVEGAMLGLSKVSVDGLKILRELLFNGPGSPW